MAKELDFSKLMQHPTANSNPLLKSLNSSGSNEFKCESDYFYEMLIHVNEIQASDNSSSLTFIDYNIEELLNQLMNIKLTSSERIKILNESALIRDFIVDVREAPDNIWHESLKPYGVPVEHLNSNLSNYRKINSREENKQLATTVYAAVQYILTGNQLNSCVMQLCAYREMFMDKNFAEMCENAGFSTEETKLRVLNKNAHPTPPILHYISKVIQKNVHAYFGCYSQAEELYVFGKKEFKTAIYLLIMDWQFYPLLQVRPVRPKWRNAPKGFPIPYSRADQPLNKPTNDVLANAVAALSRKCTFCEDFRLPRCRHAMRSHFDALILLQECLRKPALGDYTMQDFSSGLSLNQALPDFLVGVAVAIKAKEDHRCLFNSLSIYFLKTQSLSDIVRKAICIDFQKNENMYMLGFQMMKYTDELIAEVRKRIFSERKPGRGRESWGTSETLLLASKVFFRKIILYRGNGPPYDKSWSTSTYNFWGQQTDEYRPILLRLDGEHFEPIFPISWELLNDINLEEKGSEWNEFQRFVSAVTCEIEMQRSATRKLENNYVQENKEDGKGASSTLDYVKQIPSATKCDENTCTSISNHINVVLQGTRKTLVKKPDYIRESHLEHFKEIMRSEIVLLQNAGYSTQNIGYFINNICLFSYWKRKITEIKPSNTSTSIIMKECLKVYKFPEAMFCREAIGSIFLDLNAPPQFVNQFHEEIGRKYKKIERQNNGKKCSTEIGGCERAKKKPAGKYMDYKIIDIKKPSKINKTAADSSNICSELESSADSEREPTSNVVKSDIEEPDNNSSGSPTGSQRSVELTEEPADSVTFLRIHGKRGSLQNISDDVVELAKSLGATEAELQAQPLMCFEMTIPFQDMDKCFDFKIGKFRIKQYAHVISKLLTEKQGYCSFNARRPVFYYTEGNQKRAKDFCKLTGYCGGDCKMEFSITLQIKPVHGVNTTCMVISKGKFVLLQHKPTGRQIKGSQRQDVGKILKVQKPKKLYLTHTSAVNVKRLLHNNQEQRSARVLNTLRSEVKNAIAEQKNPSDDLILFKTKIADEDEISLKIKGYIQHTVLTKEELNIQMYNEKSLRLLMRCAKKEELVIHIDATGSLIKRPGEKQVLLYVALASTTEGLRFPVAQLLAERHRQLEVSDFFRRIQYDCKQICPSFRRAIAPIIISDLSLAILHGLADGVNQMRLSEYLKKIYEVVADKTDQNNQPVQLEEDRAVLFLCSAHLINAFSKLLSKHIPQKFLRKGLRNLAIHTLARMQESDSLQRLQHVITAASLVFSVEHISEEDLNDNVSILLGNNEMQEPEESALCELFLNDLEESQYNKLKVESPFYHFFKSICAQVELALDKKSNEKLNPYYNPLVIKLLQDHYAPFIPLFSTMTLLKTNRTKQVRFSNAVIESEFNIIKNVFHQEGLAKYNIFVRKNFDYFEGSVKHAYGLVFRNATKPNIPNNSRKVHKRPPSGLEEEIWQRKRKTKKMCPKYLKTKTGKVFGGDPENKTPVVAPDFHTSSETNHSKIPGSGTEDDMGMGNDPTGQTLNNHNLCGLLANDGSPILHTVVNEESTFNPVSPTISMKAEDVLELFQQNQWLDTGIIDFYMMFLKSRCNVENYNIVKSDFITYTQDPDNMSHYKWFDRRQSDENPVHSIYGDRVCEKRYTLCPVLISNHWILLHLDNHTCNCTVINSKLSRQKNLRKYELSEIHQKALPKLLKNPTTWPNWTVRHAERFAPQRDGYSCGLFILAACRNILQSCPTNPISSRLQTYIDPEDERQLIVHDILNTTKEGRELLFQADEDYDVLQALLHSCINRNFYVAQIQSI